ncbi:MAG: TlpA family protein disulfide reductase [Clostridia bacterium]|nr:TlpA family protein disulfide reductase [Clostridia bacterium]
MKRIILMILSLTLILSLSACSMLDEITAGNNNTQSVQDNPAVTDSIEDTSDTAYPDFTVYDYSGNAVSLSDKLGDGKPVVFNYWTTWCPYCLEEMPDFEEVYKEYGDRVTFMIIDVNGGGNDTIPEAKSYIDEKGYTFPVYYDTNLSATYAYNVSAFPTTGIVDAKGNIYYCQAGMLNKDKLITMIEDILK